MTPAVTGPHTNRRFEHLTTEDLDEIVREVQRERLRREGPLFFQEVLCGPDLRELVFRACDFQTQVALVRTCRGRCS